MNTPRFYRTNSSLLNVEKKKEKKKFSETFVSEVSTMRNDYTYRTKKKKVTIVKRVIKRRNAMRFVITKTKNEVYSKNER